MAASRCSQPGTRSEPAGSAAPDLGHAVSPARASDVASMGVYLTDRAHSGALRARTAERRAAPSPRPRAQTAAGSGGTSAASGPIRAADCTRTLSPSTSE